jgi:hypothetical protein
MSLFSKKNIDKAKGLALKNKDKISSTVSKATDSIDKKTGGKYADKLKKVDDAAKKFAGDEPDGTSDDADAPLRADDGGKTASDLHPDPDAPRPDA